VLLLGLYVLLDVVEGLAALSLEVFQLLDHLAEHTLLQEAVHEFLMLLRGVEAGENLHRVDDLTLLLGLLSFLLLHLLEVEETTFEYELLPTDPLIYPRVVEFDDIVFEFQILLRVILEEFQIRQQSVRIRIILMVEIPSLGHVADDGVHVREGCGSN
jgi:hypothetical protein